MRVVVSLLYQSQLLPLILIQTTLHTVRLLQSLQSQHQQFGVMFVVHGRERNVNEFATLEPMHYSGVNSDCLLSGNVRSVFQIVVLSFLFGLQIETSEPAHVFFADRLINGGSSPDPLPIEVGGVGPPICLGLDVPQNHVFDGSRESWHFPRNVGFPASPGFTEMLHDGFGLVGLDSLGHHVLNVEQDGGSQLQIELTLDSLLSDGLGDALAVSAFELSGQQIAQPSLQ